MYSSELKFVEDMISKPSTFEEIRPYAKDWIICWCKEYADVFSRDHYNNPIYKMCQAYTDFLDIVKEIVSESQDERVVNALESRLFTIEV